MLYKDLREEEIKNKVGQNYFPSFDTTQIIGNVDFCVSIKGSGQSQKVLHELESLMWAEAKKGKADIYESFVQLILTIGKARTFDKRLPPAYLGAFDAEKIGFIPYNDIYEVFYQNDFNWNVTPSNHETKEFKQLHSKVQEILTANSTIYTFGKDDKEIKEFVKANFIVGKSGTSKMRIDKNNFISIYNKWAEAVKPTIATQWDIVKKYNIIDGDFYLADLLSEDNKTLKDKLYVVLKGHEYFLDRKINELGFFSQSSVGFVDEQKAHAQFWNKYERPPLEEYWDYIIERRDLLVPQDIRERKGSFFTPRMWVELSQEYLGEVLGEDWQDEYYIWDCAAGTGNLLAGLTNKYNIFASTLDQQDVDVMRERIQKGANLLENHVFQFDFLNDSFDKLPAALKAIIDDPKKRKKLIMYINPPYAESNGRVSTTRSNVQNSYIHTKYGLKLGKAAPELFAQFLIRIYFEISGCIIGEFSKLKLINGGNSAIFRSHFLADLKKLFVMPADTFDNVKGKFPIGFFIWQTPKEANKSNFAKFTHIQADVYDSDAQYIGHKNFYSYDSLKGRLNDWLNTYKIKSEFDNIGVLVGDAPDFQNNNFVCLQNMKGKRHGLYFDINPNNLNISCIYLSMRHIIPATWLNDRDQFLYPNDGWEADKEFQNDCLAFTLFHGQNMISSSEGVNHWIPFKEQEVNAKEKFASDFMARYIAGKIEISPINKTIELFEKESSQPKPKAAPLVFSAEAKAVFDAGLELWRYYHAQNNVNVNASLYDIREHFQGRNEKGSMNHKSTDAKYNALIQALRDTLKTLAQKIEPKVYQYGFLKE